MNGKALYRPTIPSCIPCPLRNLQSIGYKQVTLLQIGPQELLVLAMTTMMMPQKYPIPVSLYLCVVILSYLMCLISIGWSWIWITTTVLWLISTVWKLREIWFLEHQFHIINQRMICMKRGCIVDSRLSDSTSKQTCL